MKKTLPLLIVSTLVLFAGCTGQGGDLQTSSNDSMTQSSNQPGQGFGSVSMTPNSSANGNIAGTEQTQQSSDATTANDTSTPTASQIAMYPQLAPPKKGDTVAIIDTDFGTIKVKLFTKDVPELTKNFIELAKAGKYAGTPFHRVVQNFMIQGGDFENHDGTGGYSYKGPNTYLANEIVPTLHHLYGTLSMAKTSDPVSIGSQFFIVNNKDGTPFLDGGYSPFGQVYEGMDVVEKISALQVPGTEAPSQMVNIKKVTIETFQG